jgi:hypothetical protein
MKTISGTWRERHMWQWDSQDQEEYAMWLNTSISPAKLAREAEFDHVFTVHPNGTVSSPSGVHAPEVYHVEGEQHPRDVEIGGDDWERWSTGWTGQHGYNGAVMHASEQFAGNMATAVLREPGTYVLTTVEVLPEDAGDEDPSPAGWIVLKRTTTGYGVNYTADLLTPDDTDTNCYGEECEPGHGETLTSGWWRPDWSYWSVDDDRPETPYDVYEPDEFDPLDFDHVRWLAQRLRSRLNGISDMDGGDVIYSADFDAHHYEGKNIRPAAHPVGFTNDEISRAITLARDLNERL